MARLYHRKGSPFFQVEFRDVAGNLRRESTRLRTDNRDDVRAATRLLNQRLVDEKQAAVFPVGSAWDLWVTRFLDVHCVRSAGTLAIYKTRWVALSQFLRETGVLHPCQLHYQHGFDFLHWRKEGVSLRRVSHNMAMTELDLLKFLMNEAVRRDYATKNPLLRLRLKREPTKQKREIALDDLQKIRKELVNWPEWMAIQFEIGLYSGRRISETRIDLETVDVAKGEYTVRIKGGKVVSKPIHPALLPLFKRLLAAGHRYTHDVLVSKASKEWWRLFQKLKMPYSFHSMRVTFITTGRRAGIDRWVMMQLVDHASATVHEVYNRYSDADHRTALARIIPDAVPRIEAMPEPSCGPSPGADLPRADRRESSC